MQYNGVQNIAQGNKVPKIGGKKRDFLQIFLTFGMHMSAASEQRQGKRITNYSQE